MGKPLAKLWLFLSVSGTNTTLTKYLKKEKYQWENPLQNSGCYLQLVELIPLWPKKERKKERKKEKSQWVKPLQNFGCHIQITDPQLIRK